MSTLETLASPNGHFVQLHDGSGRELIRNVGRYLHEGLRNGDALLVVAIQEHRNAFSQELRSLGADESSAVCNGSFVLIDAEEALRKFMVDGQPDPQLFDSSIGAAVRQLKLQTTGRLLRVYGEMVGVLWSRAQFSAAMAIEELWNSLLQETEFSLFCSYPIDVFGNAFHACDVDALLCTHHHVLPAEANEKLEEALQQAMQDVLGTGFDGSRDDSKTIDRPSWATMLKAEALILSIRQNPRVCGPDSRASAATVSCCIVVNCRKTAIAGTGLFPWRSSI